TTPAVTRRRQPTHTCADLHDHNKGGHDAFAPLPTYATCKCGSFYDRLPVLAVAMLEALAAAAGAILVAADLAPAGGVFRIALGAVAVRRHQRGPGKRHFVFAGVGIELVAFHRRQ